MDKSLIRNIVLVMALVVLVSFSVGGQIQHPCADSDHDGYIPSEGFCGSNFGGTDCDDNNPAVHPGAVDICGDGIDNNCDGYIDGINLSDTLPEICDGIDNNCDGTIDEGFSDVVEICNNIDDNCNGIIDEDCPVCANCPDYCDVLLDKSNDGMFTVECQPSFDNLKGYYNYLNIDCNDIVESDYNINVSESHIYLQIYSALIDNLIGQGICILTYSSTGFFSFNLTGLPMNIIDAKIQLCADEHFPTPYENTYPEFTHVDGCWYEYDVSDYYNDWINDVDNYLEIGVSECVGGAPDWISGSKPTGDQCITRFYSPLHPNAPKFIITALKDVFGCRFDSDCDDSNICTTNACVNNTCVYEEIPNYCDDSNICTNDFCGEDCFYEPVPGCCFTDIECDDNNFCTTDSCENNICNNQLISECMAGGNCYDCPSYCEAISTVQGITNIECQPIHPVYADDISKVEGLIQDNQYLTVGKYLLKNKVGEITKYQFFDSYVKFKDIPSVLPNNADDVKLRLYLANISASWIKISQEIVDKWRYGRILTEWDEETGYYINVGAPQKGIIYNENKRYIEMDITNIYNNWLNDSNYGITIISPVNYSGNESELSMFVSSENDDVSKRPKLLISADMSCSFSDQCNDSDECTTDSCINNVCSYEPVFGCGTSGSSDYIDVDANLPGNVSVNDVYSVEVNLRFDPALENGVLVAGVVPYGLRIIDAYPENAIISDEKNLVYWILEPYDRRVGFDVVGVVEGDYFVDIKWGTLNPVDEGIMYGVLTVE